MENSVEQVVDSMLASMRRSVDSTRRMGLNCPRSGQSGAMCEDLLHILFLDFTTNGRCTETSCGS